MPITKNIDIPSIGGKEDRLARLKEARGKIAAQHTALVDAEKVSE